MPSPGVERTLLQPHNCKGIYFPKWHIPWTCQQQPFSWPSTCPPDSNLHTSRFKPMTCSVPFLSLAHPPPWSPPPSCMSSSSCIFLSTLLSSHPHALVILWEYKGYTFHLELYQILLILTPRDSRAAVWSQSIGRMAQQCAGNHLLRAKIHTQFTWLFAFVYKLYINMYPPKTVSY